MAYKANNKDALNKWRAENLDRLQNAGIPFDIVNDNRRFWFVVQEGDDHVHSGWDPSFMSDDQAKVLLDILNDVLTDDIGWELISALQRRSN